MRINVYTEELPSAGGPMPIVEVVKANYISSRTKEVMVNYGLRIYVKSHPDLHFVPPRDDDRSAVTFWCGTKQSSVFGFIEMLQKGAEASNLEFFRERVAEDCAAAEEKL